jgi:hypothetical protein
LRAILIFVHRHPLEAYLQGVLPRALVEGRIVSIEGHLRMHRDALRRFFAARESSLTIHKLRSLCRTIQAMKPRLFRPDTAYLLKSAQYPKEELFNAIKEGLDHAYR